MHLKFSLKNDVHFVSVSMCYQCEQMMVSLLTRHSDSRSLPSHSEAFKYWVLVQCDTPIFNCNAVVRYGWEGTRIPGSVIAASWQVLLSFANATHFKAKLRQCINPKEYMVSRSVIPFHIRYVYHPNKYVASVFYPHVW